MRIAFYLNLQGAGHCKRFDAIERCLPPDCELAVVGMDKLPPVSLAGRAVERVSVPGFAPRSRSLFMRQQTVHSYHDLLVNHGDNAAFTLEMVTFLSRWQPDLLVADVGLEASILGRMCGIPVLYVRQHGRRWDKGHTLAYEWACSLWAPFAQELEQADCPTWIRNKTFYSGGFSRFSGQAKASIPPLSYGISRGEALSESHRQAAAELLSPQPKNVLVMTGFGGTNITFDRVAEAAIALPQWRWHLIGITPPTRNPDIPKNMFCHGVVKDVWSYLCFADLVVANAGHNSIMEISAADVPLVCIPAPRPFEEQVCKAEVLSALQLCGVSLEWPSGAEWPSLFARAAELHRFSNADGAKLAWSQIQDAEAPMRAARFIYQIGRLCERPSGVASEAYFSVRPGG
ncbi:MAG: glycosyltransferase [Cyanobacteria bacterium J06623_4]